MDIRNTLSETLDETNPSLMDVAATSKDVPDATIPSLMDVAATECIDTIPSLMEFAATSIDVADDVMADENMKAMMMAVTHAPKTTLSLIFPADSGPVVHSEEQT